MSVYRKPAGGALVQTETHLYGSSRLGMATQHLAPDTTVVLSGGFVNGKKAIFTRGEKLFELANHLQNVLVTISDKKIGVDADNNGQIDYYNADVISAQDYAPFGSLLPGRQYGTKGRYGFNGKENDNEVKGEGNQQDYGMRIYDPRLGRFLSVDPLTKQFPFYTPYQFSGNKPIAFIDLDGLEDRYYALEFNFNSQGKLTNVSFKELEELRAGKHQLGNREWEVPVGSLGKGDATFVYVTYNENPQTIVTQKLFTHFEPKKKGFWERLFSPSKDDDIGEGYFLTGKSGGLGDPFGPGAKKVDNIPNADALISMLGGGGGTDRGLIESLQKSQGAEKIVSFLESLTASLEAGELIAEAVEVAKKETVPDPNTVHCLTCAQGNSRGNYLLDSNGHVTRTESNKPASDTVSHHEDPAKKTNANSNNSSSPQKKIKN
jgi:RHS repeat-associated protein